MKLYKYGNDYVAQQKAAEKREKGEVNVGNQVGPLPMPKELESETPKEKEGEAPKDKKKKAKG